MWTQAPWLWSSRRSSWSSWSSLLWCSYWSSWSWIWSSWSPWRRIWRRRWFWRRRFWRLACPQFLNCLLPNKYLILSIFQTLMWQSYTLHRQYICIKQILNEKREEKMLSISNSQITYWIIDMVLKIFYGYKFRRNICCSCVMFDVRKIYNVWFFT